MGYKTPAQIKNFLQDVQHRLDGPQQFLGDEPNSYRKPWDDATVRMLIFACWPYEQAAGNQAIPMVYRTVNEAPNFLADRHYWYATPRDQAIFERAGMPIFGIEQKRQLRDFDVAGTSISYPVLIMNFIKQLMQSDIPVTWEDRYNHETGQTIPGRHRNPENWPFVIIGGQSYGAPEVAGVMVDAFFLGEVEDEQSNPGLVAVFERIEYFKSTGQWGTDRMACYRSLAREFEFLYFPCFVDVHYRYEERESVNRVLESWYGGDVVPQPSKQVVGYTANISGMKLPVVKRFVRDLDSVEGLINPPLLYTDPWLGSGDLEVQRGCPAWCSFCALTFRQKPYRQRSVDTTVEFGQKLLKNTGGLHLSPFGPDFPMHTEKANLISSLLENVTDDVDASSMRVDDFIGNSNWVMLQAHGGMNSVTLGVEGNSQRMRDLVGKGAADEDIKKAVALGIKAGLRKFKLYMISSLPGEDEGDVMKILGLAKELADIRDSMGSKAVLQFSWTPMLIEANTPFQWFAPTTSINSIGAVWEKLRDLKIQFKIGGKSNPDKLTFFQIAQRASRDVGKAIVGAVADLPDYPGVWGGVPRQFRERLDTYMKHNGFLNGLADAYDERLKNDMFGWEHVDQGINVELMWVTFKQMREFLEKTDSKTYDQTHDADYHGSEWIERCDQKCYGKTCGVCSVEDLKIRRGYIQGAARETKVDLSKLRVIDQQSVKMKIRAKVRKGVEHRVVMNDHFRFAFRRSAYRAGLPITKRSVQFATENLKFKDFTSGVDYVEFGLTKKLPKTELAALMQQVQADLYDTGTALRLEDWGQAHVSTPALNYLVGYSLYEMALDVDPLTAGNAIDNWKQADYVPMVFRTEVPGMGVQKEEVNGKEYVGDLWLVQSGSKVALRSMIRGKADPYILYAALFQKNSWLEAARYPAERVDVFIKAQAEVQDFFRPSCQVCGFAIPITVLDVPSHPDYCPKCRDAVEGRAVDVEVGV